MLKMNIFHLLKKTMQRTCDLCTGFFFGSDAVRLSLINTVKQLIKPNHNIRKHIYSQIRFIFFSDHCY